MHTYQPDGSNTLALGRLLTNVIERISYCLIPVTKQTSTTNMTARKIIVDCPHEPTDTMSAGLKKKQSPYMLFKKEHEKEFAQAHQAGQGSTAKIATSTWSQLDTDQRRDYEDRAKSIQAQYIRKYGDSNRGQELSGTFSSKTVSRVAEIKEQYERTSREVKKGYVLNIAHVLGIRGAKEYFAQSDDGLDDEDDLDHSQSQKKHKRLKIRPGQRNLLAAALVHSWLNIVRLSNKKPQGRVASTNLQARSGTVLLQRINRRMPTNTRKKKHNIPQT